MIWGINGRQQRALFVVRGKLAMRQFVREPGKLLGLIIAALVFFPLVLGMAVLTVLGYWHLPNPWPAQLLGIVLTLLWLGWMLYPVLFSTLNEGLDITRLLVYPLSGRDIAVSVVMGTLSDYMTYVVLPLYGAVLLGWWRWQGLLLILLALLLAYGHMILASQLVLTIFGGIFQSRRFRDVAVVLGSLSGAACYFVQYASNFMATFGSESVSPEQLAGLRPLNLLQWLPPGAAARAIEQAAAGHVGVALAWLGYTAVWLLLVGWLWWWLLQRLSMGEGFLLNGGGAVAGGGKTAVLPAAHRRHWLPDDLHELVVKELKSIWRTPLRRMNLFWGALLPIFMVGPLIASRGLPQTVPSWLGVAFPAYVVFAVWTATQNMLGFEGQGLAVLLLLPVARYRIFVAKTLALLLVSLPVLLLLTVGLHWFMGGWLTLVGTAVAVAGGGITLGGTAVASVLFPYPVNLEKGTGGSMLGGGGGCRSALGNALAVPLGLLLLNAPLWAGLGWAYWRELPWLGYGVAVVGLPYGVWLYWQGVRQAGRLLGQREAEILAALLSPSA